MVDDGGCLGCRGEDDQRAVISAREVGKNTVWGMGLPEGAELSQEGA